MLDLETEQGMTALPKASIDCPLSMVQCNNGSELHLAEIVSPFEDKNACRQASKGL
jgi:hypothetical protein